MLDDLSAGDQDRLDPAVPGPEYTGPARAGIEDRGQRHDHARLAGQLHDQLDRQARAQRIKKCIQGFGVDPFRGSLFIKRRGGNVHAADAAVADTLFRIGMGLFAHASAFLVSMLAVRRDVPALVVRQLARFPFGINRPNGFRWTLERRIIGIHLYLS